MTNSNSGVTDGEPIRQGSKSLTVEGWRFLPHSYAIVNQWQLLALRRRSINVRILDVPFYRASWQAQTGLFDPVSEHALRSLELAQPGDNTDVTLRMFVPFTFSPSRSRVTAVFATLEQQLIQKHQLASLEEYEKLRREPPPADVKVITPSQWSAQGFYRAAFDPDQVLVIPHGVDNATFRPTLEVRDDMRNSIPISNSEFVFLSVGAMSGNKGIDLLLRGFAEIRRRFPFARLVLKGLDGIYDSHSFLLKTIRSLSRGDQQLVLDKMTYLGNSLSHQAMAALYQVADTYVSPYRAEGFNMPVLEAAACGIPIICTHGGATDDFVTDGFAKRIDSILSAVRTDGQDAFRLEPNLDSLIALMTSAIEDNFWRKNAGISGPQHVSAHYTWDHVVDRLITKLLT